MRCDVIVLGGGPAGAQIARTLALEGLTIILLGDRPKAKPWLETLDARAKPAMSEVRFPSVECFARASVWGENELVEWPAVLAPFGPDKFVARPEFESDLRVSARQAGVFVQEDRAVAIGGRPGSWDVETTTGAKYAADFIIDATGRSRLLSRRLGIGSSRADRLIAVPVELMRDANHCPPTKTLVIAVSQGWWFLGPGREGSSCAVFHTDPDLLGRNPLALLANAWTEARVHLPADFHLGRVRRPSPAGTSRNAHVTGAGWTAVGDAAATFDPLSASGLRFAAVSSQLAADAILERRGPELLALEIARLLDGYDVARANVYAREGRFKCEPFWARRASAIHQTLAA